jgi:hypothetical protein
MMWKLFINGSGDTGVPLDWAAKRLADEYRRNGVGAATNLRVVPDGGRERPPTQSEVRQLAHAAAKLLKEE